MTNIFKTIFIEKKTYLYKYSTNIFIQEMNLLFSTQKKFNYKPNFSGQLTSSNEFTIFPKFELNLGSFGLGGGVSSIMGKISDDDDHSSIEVSVLPSVGGVIIFWLFFFAAIFLYTISFFKEDLAFFEDIKFVIFAPFVIFLSLILNKFLLKKSFTKYFELRQA